MPLFKVIVRGGLLTGKKLIKEGESVELSEKDAASLPTGTVELAESRPDPKPTPKAVEPKEKSK
jgi:hypothetical protein